MNIYRKETFRDHLGNLLKVKSLLTLIVVATFCYKTMTDHVVTHEFVAIMSSIITYYFTKKEDS